jgi:hypothetical protein
MRTFQEFIQEDFNSQNATQIVLNKKTNRPLMVFFEKIPMRSFNLLRYMNSFKSEDAMTVLNNPSDYWRGLVFYANRALMVFVWRGTILHQHLCGFIDRDAKDGKVPTFKYEKLYNHMCLLDPGDDIGANWCFPFVFMNGTITTNFIPSVLNELEKQKKIRDLFQLSNQQFSGLIS